MQILNQIKVLHWQTRSFAQHKAYDDTYSELTELIDKFAEVLMGKYGRFEFGNSKIDILDSTNQSLQYFIQETIAKLNLFNEKLDPKDTDLLNIRDEILATFNKLNYLLTLS